MEDFRAIYKILKVLDRGLDDDEFDQETIGPEALGVSENRRDALLAMLADEGYVSGVTVRHYLDRPQPVVIIESPRVTLRGLEYLQENSLMRRAADIARGIASAM
jgi:hypothetical protein